MHYWYKINGDKHVSDITKQLLAAQTYIKPQNFKNISNVLNNTHQLDWTVGEIGWTGKPDGTSKTGGTCDSVSKLEIYWPSRLHYWQNGLNSRQPRLPYWRILRFCWRRLLRCFLEKKGFIKDKILFIFFSFSLLFSLKFNLIILLVILIGIKLNFIIVK